MFNLLIKIRMIIHKNNNSNINDSYVLEYVKGVEENMWKTSQLDANE